MNSPETDLVLATAVMGPADGRRRRINALAARDLDWNAVIQTARRHGTLPLLIDCLAGQTAPPIPPAAAEQIRTARRNHALRCLALSGALIKIVNGLRAAGIRVLTFKGPTLALLAYGDVALRQFNDLDLWVHPADFERSQKLLAHLGFHSRFEAEPEKERYELQESGHLLFESNERLLVELHARLAGKEFHFPADFDDFWSRRQQLDLAGEQLDTFSSEDLFLYLCAHGAKHSWCNLGWICDCGEFVRRQPQIDWQRVTERARAAHCRRILLLGLSLAAEQSEIAIPPSLAAELAGESKVGSMQRQIGRDLFSAKRPVFAHALLGFRSRDRLRDSLRHSLSLVFVTRQADWETMHLSPRLWRAYPLFRPVRLSLKYLHLLLRQTARSLSRMFGRAK